MAFLNSFPRRSALISLLFTFCTGIALGSLVVVPWQDILLNVSLVALGFVLLSRVTWVQLVSYGLIGLSLGFWWANHNLAAIRLTEPFVYQGAAEVVSLRSTTPPKERLVVVLREEPHAGKGITAFGYDYTVTPGTIIAIMATVEPSKSSFGLGSKLVGTTNNLQIRSVIAGPNPIARFRQRLSLRIGASLPEPYASLATGLITGVNDAFSSEFKEELQRTGMTHVVAVSGYNLTIFALVMQRLGRRWRANLGNILALASLVLYVIVAGANPPILRGAVVACFSLVALAAGRVTHRLILILLAAAVLSIFSPLGMLYSLSWQLSFLSFTGILFISPLITPHMEFRFGSLGALAGETLSAQILVLPLILWKFGTVSLISPLVNMMVLSFVPFAMGMSALHGSIALVSLSAARWFAWLSYPILALIVKPIQWSSLLPLASITISQSNGYVIVLLYLCIAGLFFTLFRRQKVKNA